MVQTKSASRTSTCDAPKVQKPNICWVSVKLRFLQYLFILYLFRNIIRKKKRIIFKIPSIFLTTNISVLWLLLPWLVGKWVIISADKYCSALNYYHIVIILHIIIVIKIVLATHKNLIKIDRIFDILIYYLIFDCIVWFKQ